MFCEVAELVGGSAKESLLGVKNGLGRHAKDVPKDKWKLYGVV